MIVKVCGMREADNIREVEAAGIDRLVFLFVVVIKKSIGKIQDKGGRDHADQNNEKNQLLAFKKRSNIQKGVAHLFPPNILIYRPTDCQAVNRA